MQPVGNHARTGFTICQTETVTVSGVAGEGDYRQWLSADNFALPLPDKQQMTDAAQNQEDVNNIRQAMKSAKGPGNFRNMFMYSPNGKKDGIQIIPLSEVAAKDELKREPG